MNKPVAWMLVDEINGDYMLERHPSGDYDWIPLYTHPADLTDEEWIATYQTWLFTSNDPLVLKQAILRKAQEK